MLWSMGVILKLRKSWYIPNKKKLKIDFTCKVLPFDVLHDKYKWKNIYIYNFMNLSYIYRAPLNLLHKSYYLNKW